MILAFLLYLWGIETGKTDLTYIITEAHFYSTYEELKRKHMEEDPRAGGDFYSTYEELKHIGQSANSDIEICIFTLPMRNWNLQLCFRLLVRLLRFLLYLWGIETSFPFSLLPFYPAKHFYSTYEELKRIASLDIAVAAAEFLLYLWGIETLTMYLRFLLL